MDNDPPCNGDDWMFEEGVGCYRIFEQGSWNGNNEACADAGGHLAVPQDATEWSAFLRVIGPNNPYLGGQILGGQPVWFEETSSYVPERSEQWEWIEGQFLIIDAANNALGSYSGALTGVALCER